MSTTQICATFADETTSVRFDTLRTKTVRDAKNEIKSRLITKLKNNFCLDPIFHPDDKAIHFHTTANITIQNPIPSPTIISHLVNGDNDYLTATVTAPISNDISYAHHIGPLHAMAFVSEPQLVPHSDLTQRVDDLFAIIKTLRDEAAASELKLRDEAAASEMKLRDEAAASELKLRDEAAASELKLRDEAAALKKETSALKKETSALRKETSALKKHAEASELKLTDEATETEERLSKDIGALRGELAQEKQGRRQDIECIRDLTLQLMPLHLRTLLDEARQKVLQRSGSKTWDDFMHQSAPSALYLVVFKMLQGTPRAPSEDAVKLICSYSNVRREGNAAAHTATKDQVRQAVMSKTEGGQERKRLQQVFEFTYDDDMYDDPQSE